MTTTEAKKPSTTITPDRKESPLAKIARGLEARREQFRMMLPSHISAEHFERVVMTAVNIDPELMTADPRSLFNACARAANDGLLPDKREGALVVFKDSQGNRLVTWMPMVYGLIKKIRQSGEIDSIGARIVYQNEIDAGRFRFIVEDGQEKLYHDPMLWGDRGAKVLVYAYARFKSGFVQYMPIHRDDVVKRRRAARTDKVWASWEEEMWLKTGIRAIASRLPLSAEIRKTLERDDEGEDPPSEFEKMRNAAIASLATPLAQVEEAEVIVQPAQTVIDEPPPADDPSQLEPAAPEPAPAETSEPAGLFPQKQDERKEVTPDEYTENAVAGVSEFDDVVELEAYANRMRMGLIQMQPPLEDRRRLLSLFNRTVDERISALRGKS